VEEAEHVHPSAAGRDRGDAVGSVHDGAEAVAAAVGEEGEGGGRGHGQVALLLAGGAEVEAGAGVHDEPRLELAVGDRRADVGRVGAGGEVPVHVADVVARCVEAAVAGLGAAGGDEAAVVALEEAVELAGDLDLELAQAAFSSRDLPGAPGNQGQLRHAVPAHWTSSSS
jgi:hypothetical protein